jgi:hypothetical protein
MRLNRDPNAPKKLTDDQRAKINAEDKELQQILKNIEAIKDEINQLGDDPDQRYNRVSLKAAQVGAERHRDRRRLYLKN